MFEFGFWELALILVIALIVIGPERLPEVARVVGHWVGRARRYIEGVKGEVEKEFDTAELKRLLHNQEVRLRELQNKINNPEDLLNKEYAESVANKIEPPVENQYEIIEEKDYHAEHQAAEQIPEKNPVPNTDTPAADPKPDKLE